jgi:hypothetical protein
VLKQVRWCGSSGAGRARLQQPWRVRAQHFAVAAVAPTQKKKKKKKKLRMPPNSGLRFRDTARRARLKRRRPYSPQRKEPATSVQQQVV